AADAGAPLWRLDLLSGDERERVLTAWNATGRALPAASIVALVEHQAAARPEAIAVSMGAMALRYGDLAVRVEALARVLRARGVGPERVVGVLLERSLELVVGVLAVLKAGGAFLPLDPSHPAARLAQVLGDAGAGLVLTTRALAARLPADLPLLFVDALEQEAPREDTPFPAPLADQLAYVIYTSGSTGQPKGVAVSARSLLNKVTTLGERFGVSPGFGYALLSSPAFDPAIEQMLVPLAHGGRVVIIDEATQAAADRFWSLIAREGVHLLNGVPSFFAEMIDAAPAGLALDYLVLGGEAVPAALAERLCARLAIKELVNFYGPTEATIDAVGYVADGSENAAMLPIGAPLANYRAYVLDEHLSPVGVGCVGELYLGGVGVARGYVGRGDLTAERFLADPFGGDGGRLYRTGDLARWRGDGVLEFLGRSDGQVKLRGVRIELGEVEAALLSHDGVSGAAADVRADRLVGYVVGAGVSAASLRSHLAARLPAALVPASLVFLDHLPRTASGKLDRRALPAPAPVASEAPPQGAAEELLAALWRDLLQLARVGRFDNFFELGGHSLLAMQLVARLRRVFGVELGVRALFEHPVLSEMAALVSGAAAAEALVVEPRPALVPLSFGQERLWFLAALTAGPSYTTVPLALRLSGALDAAALARALRAIVERHEALRTVYPVVDGVAVQQVADAARFALGREEIGEGELAARLADLARHRFDLAQDLPVTAVLLRLGAADHVLALAVHHIAFDGWSAGVLVRELAAAYRSALSAGPASLPSLPLQYADWALWQRRRRYAAGLGYWRRTLMGAPEVLALPTDRPRGARRGRGAAVAVPLDGALTARLRALCRSEGVTLFMALYAALCVVLWRWSGSTDVVVGTAAAGRERAEVEGLIGFFVNTLALRMKLDGSESVRGLLAEARAVALSAYAHQAVPFEQVVDALKPSRRLDASPLFQVMLVLQGETPAAPSLAGLAVEALEVPVVSAPFDLT
ncbi:MAG TPA: amino acid adenylation domain-containing protein, partial [Burkholderiales bacterium]|nr:amino acid adenylation domain-containing protein [Burkholderiales bacterium]